MEPNIDFFYQNPDLGGKFPTLPWDKNERASSKGDLFHLLVSDVHQNKKEKKTTTTTKEKKKESKKKKKRKKKNQSIKNRKEQKENRKEKQVLWKKQCLNHVQSCCKE